MNNPNINVQPVEPTQPRFDEQAETESCPTLQVNVGETYVGTVPEKLLDVIAHTNGICRARHAIVWVNGKRWEGTLYENTGADDRHYRG